MSGFISVNSSAAHLLSLSLQTIEYLCNFYTNYRGQQELVDQVADRLGDLLRLLQLIHQAVGSWEQEIDEQNIILEVQHSITSCEDIIHEFQEQALKFQKEPGISSHSNELVSTPKTSHPFKQSTLLKLDEDVDEFRRGLSGTLQALQIDESCSPQDQPEPESSTTSASQEPKRQCDLQSSSINIDGHAQVVIGDVSIHNDTTEVADLLRRLLAQTNSAALRQWLRAPDATVDLNVASAKRHAGTGQWLLRNPVFVAWSDRPNSLLWLHGFAGCGKSVLLSTAVEYVFHLRQSKPVDIAAAFFFFTFNDGSKQDASSALRALLLQLCAQIPGLEVDLMSLKESSGYGLPPLSTLLELIQHAAGRCSHIYILLDALDESPEGSLRDEVLSAIETVRQWQLPGLHLLVTSRDVHDIRDKLLGQDGEQMALKNEDMQQDISDYVSYHVDNDRQLQQWGHYRQKIKSYLTQHAGGVFRWVACQLRPLQQCPRSEKHLEKCLRTLPRSLDETYERILCNIEFQEEARQMLSLLCFASRPLAVDEVLEALAVDLDDLECYDPMSRLTGGAGDLLRLCPGLIEIGDYNDGYSSMSDYTDIDYEVTLERRTVDFRRVRIAHFSVQEYLLSDRINKSLVSDFALSESIQHGRLSKLCLLYLHGAGFQQQPLDIDLVKKYAFAKYAAERWYHHYHLADSQSAKQTEKTIIELLTTKPKLERWLRLHDPERLWDGNICFDQCPNKRLDKRFRNRPSATYFASFLGLNSVLIDILAISSEDINALSGRCGTALQAASSEGDRVIVQMLLDHGADVNAGGGFFGSALHAASYYGEEDIVEILILHGADIDALGFDFNSALQAASSGGYQEVVQMLLDNGADVNLQLGACGSALHQASYEGHTDVVQMLIEHGASVNAQGSRCGTALQAASVHDNEEIMQTLLDNGADVNFQGGRLRTALSSAAYNGNETIVRMLLSRGAEVNIRNSQQCSALHLAAYGGHEAIVHMLIRSGADVHRRTDQNGTALHAAVLLSGNEKVVQILLDYGVDVNAEGGCYKTALSAALTLGRDRMVQMLLDAGAHVSESDHVKLQKLQRNESSQQTDTDRELSRSRERLAG